MRGRSLALTLALALSAAVSARASVLIDPYDNILAPDGFYALGYFNYTQADEFMGSSGDKAEDVDFTATIGILRPIAYFHLGPVPLAFQAIVPFGKIEETDVLDEDSSGLGDIIFGPGVFLYTNEKSGSYVSYWFYAYAPTGEWDNEQFLNLGQNHWYFEHQLALFQSFGKLVADVNLNYYHHTEEPDNDLQAPPRFEVAVSVAYPLTEKLMVGAHGGGYWDLDDYEADGDSIDGTNGRKVSLGPTATYQFTQKLGSTLRWTHDLSAANDFKGDDLWLRLNYAF